MRRTALGDVDAVAAGPLHEEISRELGLWVLADGTLAGLAGLERRRFLANGELIEAVWRVGRWCRVEETKAVVLRVRDGHGHRHAYIDNDQHLDGSNP
jgi:hypothetical protein